jgi:hypothetical protein
MNQALIHELLPRRSGAFKDLIGAANQSHKVSFKELRLTGFPTRREVQARQIRNQPSTPFFKKVSAAVASLSTHHAFLVRTALTKNEWGGRQ